MFRIIFCYLNIYLIWGSTYFFNKLAVQTIPAFYVIGLRSTLGGLLILLLVALTKNLKKLPDKKEFLSSALVGILLFIGGSGLVTVALKYIDSYLASLIISCIPLVVLIMEVLILKKKAHFSAMIGIALGLLGVSILLYDGNSHTFIFNKYIFIIFTAVVLWSLGTILSKILPLPKNSFINSSIQLSTVGIICLIGVQFFLPAADLPWQQISTASWLAIWYLAIFGTMAVISFVYLLKHEPSHRIVTYTFVNPLIAIFLGVMFGGETPVLGIIPGSLLIFTGLAIMFYWEPKKEN
jgi:drug/metabolite transporter (DMT)-like permease